MPKVCVDDHVSEIKERSIQKIKDLLEAVRTSLPANRVVTTIMLDGKIVSRRQETQLLEAILEKTAELNIRTADKAMWEMNGLDYALNCIERVQKSLLTAVERFRENTSDSRKIFSQCLEGLDKFLDTLWIARCSLRLDLQKTGETNLEQIEKEFTKLLISLADAYDKEDFELLSDKIEYELLTSLYSWIEALRKLRLTSVSHA